MVIFPFNIRNGSVHYKAYSVCFSCFSEVGPSILARCVPSGTNFLIGNIFLDCNYVVSTVMFFHMCQIGNSVKCCQSKVCSVFFKPFFSWYKNQSFFSVCVMPQKNYRTCLFCGTNFVDKNILYVQLK